jgi:hypothetical protein
MMPASQAIIRAVAAAIGAPPCSGSVPAFIVGSGLGTGGPAHGPWRH